VQAHQRGTGVQNVQRQVDVERQQAVLCRPRADGEVSGIREVLHGREHKESDDDGHDRGGRRRAAHVEHGGRRVLHRPQVRDAVAAVGQPGRAVRGHQQRGERAGVGHVRVLRANTRRRLPGLRLLQPVRAGPGRDQADVPGLAEQHRGGRRVFQVAVANVPGRDTGEAARLQHGHAGQLSARLLPGERVAGRVQQDRLQAAAEFPGRAEAAGVDGTVLRAKLQDGRAGVLPDGGGQQPVRANADGARGRHVPRVPGEADAEQLRHVRRDRRRGDRRAAGEGRDEDRVQPAGQHGAGQGGQDAHQLLQRRQRVAGPGEVRPAGAGHHRAELGTRVGPERVFEPGQRHALLVETDAGQH